MKKKRKLKHNGSELISEPPCAEDTNSYLDNVLTCFNCLSLVKLIHRDLRILFLKFFLLLFYNLFKNKRLYLEKF